MPKVSVGVNRGLRGAGTTMDLADGGGVNGRGDDGTPSQGHKTLLVRPTLIVYGSLQPENDQSVDSAESSL